MCSRRPVFDTVDMLTLHRNGKRHLEGEIWSSFSLRFLFLSLYIRTVFGFVLSSRVFHCPGLKWFYGKKAWLQNEIDKRQHQEYVKEEDDQQVNANACFF